jgi:hypothetical protein
MRKSRLAPELKTPKRPTPAELVPRRVEEPTLDDHLEILTRAVFQAGLSWAIIEARWKAFRGEFSSFDVHAVANYGEWDVERLMTADGILHSRKKIAGTVKNARTLLELVSEFGTIGGYLERFASYPQVSADVRKRFAFVGDLSCYYWLFRTGQRVPVFEQWITTQAADHPRMREMVLAGRAAGTSTESAGF